MPAAQRRESFRFKDVDPGESGRSRSRRRRSAIDHRRDGRGGNGGDAPPQRRHVAFTVRMHAVRQEDHVAPGPRIDPQRRAGEACVAERSGGEQIAAIPRIRRVDVPAEAACFVHAGRRHRMRHSIDGQRRQNADSSDSSAAQEHPAELGQIGRGAEQSGMAGHAAHAPRRRVVHGPAQKRDRGIAGNAGPRHRPALLGRRNPRPPGIGRQERG